MKVRNRIIALSFTIGLISTSLALPAQAAESTRVTQEVAYTAPQPTITAAANAAVTFTKSEVTSTPAPEPVVQAPVVAVQSSPEAATTASRPTQPAPQVQAPSNPAPVAAISGAPNSAIAQAALAQLGVHQDCTALVSNSLLAVGIHFHGWPAGYLSLGHTVSAAQAQPGDLIFYANAGAGVPHIAVYIGGGQAVHGGFNGENTQIASAYLGSGPVFIHVDR